MFDVNIQFDDIHISSVESEDILLIQSWYALNTSGGLNDKIRVNEFYDRFLEYYISECEFFLKITKSTEFIGALKGRIEFKNPNEVWLWFFMLDSKVRNKGLGTNIIQQFIDYFHHTYGIRIFYVVVEQELSYKNFFIKQGFEFQRITKNFFYNNEKFKDVMIMRKIRGNNY